jgi:hypothetical protein
VAIVSRVYNHSHHVDGLILMTPDLDAASAGRSLPAPSGAAHSTPFTRTEGQLYETIDK